MPLRSILAALLFIGLLPAQKSPFYKFTTIVKTGDLGLTSVAGASTNDKGTVAFVGRKSVGGVPQENLYTYDPVSGVVTPLLEDAFVLPSTGADPTQAFSERLQVRNDDIVVATRRLNARVLVPCQLAGLQTSTPLTYLEKWVANKTDIPQHVAMGDAQLQFALGCVLNPFGSPLAFLEPNPPFQAIFPSAITGNNVNQFGLGAIALSGINTRATGVHSGIAWLGGDTPGLVIQPSMADTGNYVFSTGTSGGNLVLESWDFSKLSFIAGPGNGFATVGTKPGISDDGRVVVFYGDLTTPQGNTADLQKGPGIFAFVIQASDNTGSVFRVTGGGSDLGLDAAGNAIDFDPAGWDPNSRIVVTNLSLGESGPENDVFVAGFIGKPSSASRNYVSSGKPLLFSSQTGVWSTKVTLRKGLVTPFPLVANASSALPVIQIGDQIDGRTVTSITIDDSLANLATTGGVVRTQRPGDHQFSIVVQSAGGSSIIRAVQADSDSDGLFDHWETEGIDIDGDGIIDLDLPAMGASRVKRDMFIEADFLTPQHVPYPGVLSSPEPGGKPTIVYMFDDAPSLVGAKYGVRSDGTTPSDIQAGITLHLDGGRANNWNMGSEALKGGDFVAPSRAFGATTVVYLGVPGSLTVPGLDTRPFQTLKDQFFAPSNRGARELAFRYVIFSDFFSTFPADGVPFTGKVVAAANGTANCPAVGKNPSFEIKATLQAGAAIPPKADGNFILITTGTGAGQLSKIGCFNGSNFSLVQPWKTVPDATSSFVALDGASGIAEERIQKTPNNHAFAGNDVLLTMKGVDFGKDGNVTYGSVCKQWRTLAHELGHTLGLRHGGTDGTPNRGNEYLSLMSYSFQNQCTPFVQSYSVANDNTFADWLDLRMDFPNNLFHLAVSTNRLALSSATPVAQTPELNELQVDGLNGLSGDRTPPALTVTKPVDLDTLPFGADIVVEGTASDDSGVSPTVRIEADLNGNGVTTDSGEQILASLAGGAFRTTIAGFTVSGSQTIAVTATDQTTNARRIVLSVTVSGPLKTVPDLVGMVQSAASAAVVSAGLVVRNVTTAASSTVPAGSVISQSPASGTQVNAGSNVDFVVSTGPAQVAVPSVTGTSQAAATAALQVAGLVLGGVTTATSSLVAVGDVISQSPGAATLVNSGSAVSLVVSTGPAVYTISGQVTRSGAGLVGVTITVSAATRTTDSVGNFAFAGLAAGGNHTVTPSLAGYSFSPASVTINNLSASQTSNFVAVSDPRGTISAPTPGSRLAGAIVDFTWNAGVGVQDYWLDVGTSAGAGNIYGGVVTGTTKQVTNVPCTGFPVYARLWTRIAGAYLQPIDYSYIAAASCVVDPRATLTSPTPGSTLTGTSATFTWTAGTGLDAYWLDVGTAVGSGNLASGQLTALTKTVSGLPSAGQTVYARLWSRAVATGAWLTPIDYTFTAASASDLRAKLTSPLSGVLPGASTTFNWSAGTGADGYWLDVGPTAGSGAYSSGLTTALTRTVTGLPCTGGTVFARLWTRIGGAWQTPIDYPFTLPSSCTADPRATMASPVAGSTLTGSPVTFTWLAGTGTDGYWLDVGPSLGSGAYSNGLLTALSKTVTGLPCTGAPAYARLWTRIAGAWQTPIDYTYTSASSCVTDPRAALTSPAPSSTLAGSSVTFSWTAGTGPDGYWLDVGPSVGSGAYTNGLLTAVSKTVAGLPCNGSTVYARLWTRIAGAWQTPLDYVYAAAGSCSADPRAVLSSPAPGSRITGASATFSWTAGTGADAYWLDVGPSVGSGAYSNGLLTALSKTVSGLPNAGGSATVFVRLWTRIGGAWQTPIDYTFTN